MRHPKNKEGRLLVKPKRDTRGKECKEIIHEHFPKVKEVVFQIKGSTSHPTVQRFLKRNTMKFQMPRVKEETLDDSRKKTRFHTKPSNSSTVTMETKIPRSKAFQLLNDFQSRILYQAKLSTKTNGKLTSQSLKVTSQQLFS